MIRGMVIIDKVTGERKLFLNKEEENKYIKTLLTDKESELAFEWCPFEKMLDSEKIKVLKFNYNKMKEFEDSINSTGRSYTNEIRINIQTLEWLLNRLQNKTRVL